MSPLRDKLREIEGQITTLTKEKGERQKALEDAKDKFATSGEDPADSENSPLFKAAKEARGSFGTVVDKINDLTGAQVEILRMLGEDGSIHGENGNRGGPPHRDNDNEGDSAGWSSKALFTNDMETRLKALANSSGKFGAIELGEVASREAMKAELTGTTASRTAASLGLKRDIYRPLRVLDLIPSGVMDNNTLPYVQEGGAYNALETVEGTTKPDLGLTLVDATATAQTIAAYQKVRKQVLEDTAALQSILDERLRYAVRRRLEGQVIAGNGTDPNLRGILNTSGIGTVTFTAGDVLADKILAGITQIYLADGEADGAVVNPANWQTILSAKTSGSGEYLSGGPFSPIPSSIWGISLLPSPAIASGTGLVGDFRLGAQVFVRSGVVVLMSDSDGTDFIQNRVTLLGEGRFALAVWKPSVFSKVALA